MRIRENLTDGLLLIGDESMKACLRKWPTTQRNFRLRKLPVLEPHRAQENCHATKFPQFVQFTWLNFSHLVREHSLIMHSLALWCTAIFKPKEKLIRQQNTKPVRMTCIQLLIIYNAITYYIYYLLIHLWTFSYLASLLCEFDMLLTVSSNLLLIFFRFILLVLGPFEGVTLLD